MPKGLYEIAEPEDETAPKLNNEEELKFTEDFTMGTVEELRSTENWSNLMPMILKAGRCTHIEPTGVDDDDIQAKKDALDQSDPQLEARFRTINEQEQIVLKGKQGEPEKAWISKVCGDT